MILVQEYSADTIHVFHVVRWVRGIGAVSAGSQHSRAGRRAPDSLSAVVRSAPPFQAAPW